MKKFLLLTVLALFGFMAPALAQVTVTCDGKEVKDGDVLKFYAVTDDFGDVAAGPESEPYFKTTKACKLKVQVKTSANAANGKLSWCGVTTQCAYIKGGSEVRENDLKPFPPLPMKLHAEFTEGNYETYTATVTVYVDNKKYMTFEEHFIYSKDGPTGIENASVAEKAVKFDGKVVRYAFESATPRLVQIFGMDGKLAKEVATGAQHGTFGLNELQQGVYVYSVLEQGKKVESGKVVLK